jgi:hypothetical protein
MTEITERLSERFEAFEQIAEHLSKMYEVVRLVEWIHEQILENSPYPSISRPSPLPASRSPSASHSRSPSRSSTESLVPETRPRANAISLPNGAVTSLPIRTAETTLTPAPTSPTNRDPHQYRHKLLHSTSYLPARGQVYLHAASLRFQLRRKYTPRPPFYTQYAYM